MLVYLIPVGRGGYDLYSEAVEPTADDPPPRKNVIARASRRVHEGWHDLVQSAQHRTSGGRWARLQDHIVCRLAEALSEQRTLRTLRDVSSGVLVHPADLDPARARSLLVEHLAVARRHHAIWLSVDAAALVASGPLMLVPGPNIVAYYFAFRAVGHYLSWRGAAQAGGRTEWQTRAEPALTELGRLSGLPRGERAARVEAIAAALNLPRLADFFDRAALPVA